MNLQIFYRHKASGKYFHPKDLWQKSLNYPELTNLKRLKLMHFHIAEHKSQEKYTNFLDLPFQMPKAAIKEVWAWQPSCSCDLDQI